MKKFGVGGSKTAKAGADFEQLTTDRLIDDLRDSGFTIIGVHKLSKGKNTIHGIELKKDSKRVDIYFKTGLYKLFFEPREINYKDFFSAQLQPDSAIYSYQTKVLTIIEKKQQEVSGSVAEKLQTCDYKLMYYKKLVESLDVEIDLVWQLGSYFIEQEENLRSVYEYMLSRGSRYFFHQLPLSELKI